MSGKVSKTKSTDTTRSTFVARVSKRKQYQSMESSQCGSPQSGHDKQESRRIHKSSERKHFWPDSCLKHIPENAASLKFHVFTEILSLGVFWNMSFTKVKMGNMMDGIMHFAASCYLCYLGTLRYLEFKIRRDGPVQEGFCSPICSLPTVLHLTTSSLRMPSPSRLKSHFLTISHA